MKRSYDVIVAGMGLAGLSTAAMLTNDGYKVLCLEKSHQLGGRAKIWKKNGFTFEYGLHVVRYGNKGGCGKVLEQIGVKDFKPKKLGVVVYDDGFKNFIGGNITSLYKTELLDAKGKVELVKKLYKLWRNKDDFLYNMTVKGWCNKQEVSDDLRKVLGILSGSMIVCPDISKASMGELSHHIMEVLRKRFSIGYPEGGFEKIMETLEDKILENNEIIYGSQLQGITLNKGMVDGAIVNGKRYEAKSIVMAFHPKEMEKIMNFKTKVKPNKGISLDYALSTDEFEEKRIVLTTNPVGMGMFTSNIDKTVAPEGKSLFTFFSPVENLLGYDRKKQNIENLIEEMFPGFMGKVDFKRAMKLKMVDGVELNIDQSYEKRAGNKIIDGLYIAGDYTQAHGNGGEIAFNSALKCYEEVKKWLNI